MRYFTREWYQSIQDADASEEPTGASALELSNRASAAYDYYLSSVAPRLPGNVAVLVCLHLHDAKIISFTRSDNGLTLVLRDMYSRRHYNREIVIEFSGVDNVVGLEGSVGQDIIYDEVEVKEDAKFEYCALLDNTEFLVRFEAVHIQACDISS